MRFVTRLPVRSVTRVIVGAVRYYPRLRHYVTGLPVTCVLRLPVLCGYFYCCLHDVRFR